MISIVLLSGGLSSRFGYSKALVPWGDGVIISHLQRILLLSEARQIVIVLGAHADQIKPYLLKHKKIKVVYNKDFQLGQTASLQAGLREVISSAQGFGVLPVDFPLIKTETINILLREFLKNNPYILLPTFDGQRGHPPLFNAVLRKEILDLPQTVGLNSIVHAHQSRTHHCKVSDDGVILSFNTPQELEILRKKVI